MKSRADHQLSLPPMPVQRLDKQGETESPKSGPPDRIGYIPLDMAKAQIGSALRQTIHGTGSALKEFGDPSHVNRVCDGEIPTVIARAWQRANTRRELVRALAEESGLFHVHLSINERKLG